MPTRAQLTARTADTLVAGPWRLLVLRALFVAYAHRPESVARGALDAVRGALVRRGEDITSVKISGGGRVVVNLGDYHHQRIAGTGEYESATTGVLRRVIHSGDVFLDVGANAGFYSAFAASIGAAVHAFEPNPAMGDLIDRAGHPNVALVRAAAGDKSGEIALNVSPDPSHSGISSVHDLPHLAGARKITVPVITIDDYCARNDIRPNVLKIDVEGHEGQVIDGMQRLLEERIPEHLIIELRRYPGFPDPEPVAQKMVDLGYRAFAIADDASIRDLTSDALDANDNVYFRRSSKTSAFGAHG